MKPIVAFAAIVLGLLLLLFAFSRADATPLTGSFASTGNFVPFPYPPTPGGGVLLNTTTALDFIPCNGFFCTPPSNANPTPGVAGEFFVTAATDDFAGFLAHTGTIKDMTFSGPSTPGFPTAPISAFEIAGLLSFDLSNVSILQQTATLLQLAGSGVFHLPGFDDTPGAWSFTGAMTCNAGFACPPAFSETWVFTSTNSSAPVPEPSVLMLIGVGLVGLAACIRARS